MTKTNSLIIQEHKTSNYNNINSRNVNKSLYTCTIHAQSKSSRLLSIFMLQVNLPTIWSYPAYLTHSLVNITLSCFNYYCL